MMEKELDHKMPMTLNRKSSGKVRPFGDSKPSNNGWIICETKADKKQYYFNVFTKCSTWQLPVPKGVEMPHYIFTTKKADVREADELSLFAVSDSDTEEEKDEDVENEDWKIDKDVLLKMYLYSGGEEPMEIDENLCCIDEEEEKEPGAEEEPERQSTGLSDFLQVDYSIEDDSLDELENPDGKEEGNDDGGLMDFDDKTETINDEQVEEEIDDVTNQKWAEFLKLQALKDIPYNDFVKRPVKKYENVVEVIEEQVGSVVDRSQESPPVVDDAAGEEKVSEKDSSATEVNENVPMNIQHKETKSKRSDSSKEIRFSSSSSPTYSMISNSPVKSLPKKKKRIISRKKKITEMKKETNKKINKMMQFKLKMTKKTKKKESPIEDTEEDEVKNKMMEDHLELSEKVSVKSAVEELESTDSWSVKSS